MRVVSLVKGTDHVCCRYRVAAFRPYLEAAGHTLDVLPWPRSWLSRLLLRRRIGRADVLLLQRRMPAAWQLALLRGLAGRLVFDFDDAIFLNDSFDHRGPANARRTDLFRRTVQAADAVVAGNDFLREQACLWADPGKVTVIPTCVDVRRYPLAGHTRTGAADLVWIGSGSTFPGLEAVRGVLEGAASGVPGVRFKVICDRFPDWDGLPILPRHWSAGTEAAELAAGDIGVSLLPRDLWSHGKCGLKVLQYMAAGLPVVANPVGVQARLVRDGENGFLAGTAGELARVLPRLRDDPGLRRRLGATGRADVEREYDVSVGARLWLRLLEGTPSRECPRLQAGTGGRV